MRRWIVRPLAWLVGGLGLVVALMAGAIRLDQYLLRLRGERLQADIRSLELRKATYADARRLEEHWWVESKEHVCRPSWCDLDIFVGNVADRHIAFFVNHPKVHAIYRRLGGRAAGAGAFIHIRDNLLWEKGIGLGIDTWSTEADGRRVQYELIANIGTDDHFTWISHRHPEYQIGGPTACTSCREGWVKFTPFADPQDVLRLTDLNFTCITRWRQCTEQAAILPTAWKQLEAENTGAWWVQPCTPAMIRVFSRQTHHVDLVKVIKLELKEPISYMTVRRLSRVPFHLENWWPEFPLVVDPSDSIHVGDQLLLFEHAYGCQTAPATAENLKAAQLGASEGWINPAHPLPSPLGEIKPPIRPPKIDVQ